VLVKNVGFATSLPNTMLQICGNVGAVGFSVQNGYKMTYVDEDATVEPVNGYKKTLLTRLKYYILK
jgi:hypothetical protein